ncbi:HicB family toxin-antitoxin system [Rhodococcus hoagii]|nr:HicB family toxin-antitoxin system [Prescottella equi]NKS10237.1 HicB family toxin-antitoxin system [Prescottella equi]NKS35228.1 HicB family toxin-antitoxin system [Prescottella equi]NKS62075.1 HicB family toxin-antitoxin system [Prescottella equi]NKS68255.1 HicB family toxin-antitoxin system [Prescottella equi]
MVAVPAIDGLTQARRLAEAGDMARELIALETGEALEAVEVDVHVRLAEGEEDLAGRAASIKAARAEAEAAEARAVAESARLARELAEKNVPVRDIGTLLDLSYQRVSQLVNS